MGSANSFGPSTAWRWDPIGGMVSLNDLVPAGWNITDAYDINNSGQILGYGQYGGNSYLVRLDPITAVPEPATLLLSGAALGMIAARRRRSVTA